MGDAVLFDNRAKTPTPFNYPEGESYLAIAKWHKRGRFVEVFVQSKQSKQSNQSNERGLFRLNVEVFAQSDERSE